MGLQVQIARSKCQQFWRRNWGGYRVKRGDLGETDPSLGLEKRIQILLFQGDPL